MIAKVGVCAALLAACSYTDPPLDSTEFRCAVDDDCPSDQHCAGTVCVVASHDGVACGAQRCTPNETCCLDGVNAPRCIPASDVCFGTGARCDGVEDCAAGDSCCEAGTQLTCLDGCAVTACQDAQDCPSDEPNCCIDLSSPGKPWKVCALDPC